jgi:hypothetical protein
MGSLCYALITSRRFSVDISGLMCSAVAREPPGTCGRRVANVDQDNRLTSPGGTLLKIGRSALPDGPGASVGSVPRGPAPPRLPASEPSWGRVLATTIKLWVVRTRGWQAVAAVAAVTVVTVGALTVSGVFAGTAAPAAQARAAGAPSPVKAVPDRTAAPQPSAAQTAAAAWIAGQLSSDATIGCDPAMCAVLQAQGVTAARLMPLTPGSPDPRGATVVVTSSSAAEAYAPAVIASFGSGAAQIDIRATEPGGAAAYGTALRADLAARTSAGAQLLRNNRIHFTAQDAAQLRAGEVDARLLATLAALSSQYSFSVTAFGDASPGVAVLYREVTISGAGKNLTSALALVKAQVPPYQPAQVALVPPAGLNIEFAAPSPLGLLTAVLDRATR